MKMYETERFYIRPLIPDDARNLNYQKWFYDQEVCAYNSHGNFLYTESQINDFIARIESGKDILWAVIAKPSGKSTPDIHIGNITLQDISWINRTAEFACIFGEKEYWMTGCATEAIKILFHHGFDKLNLNRIWLGTAKTNIAMNQIAIKLGMVSEGYLRDHVFLEGKYVGIIQYGILRNEWRIK